VGRALELACRLALGTVPPKQEPDNVVRMTAHDIQRSRSKTTCPGKRTEVPGLFIYSQEGFEQDPAKFWRKYGKKRYDALESFLSKRKELESFVSSVVSPNDSQDVKLRKIYARVQQFRNLSYEPRKSAEEEKRDKQKKIENAADVLKYGYGSGYDLTWLFVGLARAAGFEASGGFVATRNDYFFPAKPDEQRRTQLQRRHRQSGRQGHLLRPWLRLYPLRIVALDGDGR